METPLCYRYKWWGRILSLLFILFSLFIGFPLLLAEFVIGRSTQKEAISAYRSLSSKHQLALDWEVRGIHLFPFIVFL